MGDGDCVMQGTNYPSQHAKHHPPGPPPVVMDEAEQLKNGAAPRLHRFSSSSLLVFIASRDHLDANITDWPDWAAKEGLLRYFSNRENGPSPDGQANYNNSKLMLMYVVEEICKRACATVQVIVNSICPGLVYTSIARSIVENSTLMQLLAPLYLGGIGKSADYGARFYVTAALTPKGKHISVPQSDMEKNQELKPDGKPSGFKSYMRIFNYADRTSWILYSVAVVAAIAAGSALPLMDLIFGKFVTTFNNFALGEVGPHDYMREVSKYALYLVYLFIAKFALLYIHTVAASIAAIRATKALRLDFLQSLLRQDMTYFDSKDAGSPSVKVTTNGNLVTNGISEKLSVFVQSCATFVAAFVVAFAVQWKLTLITICVVPSILVVTGVCMSIEVKNEDRLMGIYSRASLVAEEVFSSISTVHAFWLQPVMAKRYEEYLAELERVGMKKSPNYGVLFSTEFFCVYSGYGLAFWQGIRVFARGEVHEPGDIVTVIFAVIVAATALTQIAPQIIAITKAAAAADELFRIIDKKSAIDSLSTAGLTPEKCAGEIEIKGLDFAYPSRPETQVLNDLNLSVPAGKTTALVGASGCGKSTIVGLLERWYDPAAGMILLDGIDIQTLNIAWLRTQIRLVQQELVLFSGTIFDNVAFGLVGTPYAEAPYEQKLALVREACRDAYAHEFIEDLPKQYDTQIGERARMLSGGQKQRIAIARSIISRPSVLLLDEATSALDPKAERIVQSALDNISVGRTTITIAHKLSTVQKADNIVVMSAGRIIELVGAQDLEKANGKAEEQVDSEEEGVGEENTDAKSDAKLSLHHTRSVGAESLSVDEKAKALAKETMRYSLIRCLWLLIKEQRQLWGLYAIVAFVCILRGGTFPAQAVILARTFQVFQLRGSEAVRRGDFWALMFFVVALANFFLYLVLGWTANIIIQKVSRRYRRELFRNTMKQDIAFFDLEHNATGAICSRLLIHASNLNDHPCLLQVAAELFISWCPALQTGYLSTQLVPDRWLLSQHEEHIAQ
ncbi:hypothetical protein CDV55_103963 [Aspergillus turcosus]|nr:hypothetical protein CDV55_103963 [Aspergillus turcosus]